MLEGHDGLSLNVEHVVLPCPSGLGEQGPNKRACRENVGLDARVLADMIGVIRVLDGLPRRVAYLYFRHFEATGLERAIVLLAKLFPRSLPRQWIGAMGILLFHWCASVVR